MTDEEMRALIHHAVDNRLSGIQSDPFLARRVLEKGERPMKKKIAALPVLAALLIALTLTAAAAEALGVNVFELFGGREQRFASLANDAVLDETPVPATDGKTYSAQILNAYYDGETLVAAYTIQGGERLASFTPDEAMLQSMTPCEEFPTIPLRADFPTRALLSDEESKLLKQWNAAPETGKAMGLMRTSVYSSDHTVTDDGIDLPIDQEAIESGEDGMTYVIREYESPLPEAARNRESLNLSIGLSRFVTYWYYDGKTCYVGSGEPETLPPMTAAVRKAEAEIRRFTGAGQYGGIALDAACEASAVVARLHVQADGLLPALPEDHWYDCVLMDEAGRILRSRETLEIYPDGTAEVTFDGTGALPEKLTLYILEEQEGDWDRDEALETAQPISLIQAK